MKKRVLASLLVAAMAVGMMAGCGKFWGQTGNNSENGGKRRK